MKGKATSAAKPATIPVVNLDTATIEVPSKKQPRKPDAEKIKPVKAPEDIQEIQKKDTKLDVSPKSVQAELPRGGMIKSSAPTSDSLKQKDSEVVEIQPETQLEHATTQTEAVAKYKIVPIVEKLNASSLFSAAVQRKRPPLSAPNLKEQPLVLATHLVPSLPIGLFEVFVEAIEAASGRPVVLLHEPRIDRPIAKEVTDIAILPASEDWEEGVLLPTSFCFEHHLNKDESPCVYVDVVVAIDRVANVEDITDLRGHRCAIPDRHKQMGAAGLLFNYLQIRGEGPAFFGDTLDADTHVSILQLVAGGQADIGVLESPVIKCNKDQLPGMNSLYILNSLGPLPPYRIMVNKRLADSLVRKITAYLLNVNQDKEWIERFAPFGVKGFAANFKEFYDSNDAKPVVTSVRYY